MQTQRLNSILIRTIEAALNDPPQGLIDVALIGSLSGHYGWKSTTLADADVWLYTTDRTADEVRAWLLALSMRLEAEIRSDFGAKYEARAIDGPYKPSPNQNHDTFFLHLLVDDEASYLRRSVLTRFSWRKYSPIRANKLLEALAPSRPNVSQLIDDQWGISGGISILRSGFVAMPERCLTTGQSRQAVFPRGTFQFWEATTYIVMMAARNRARIMGYDEPDHLPNDEFALWYERIFRDDFVRGVALSKDQVAKAKADPIEMPGVEEWLTNLRFALEGK